MLALAPLLPRTHTCYHSVTSHRRTPDLLPLAHPPPCSKASSGCDRAAEGKLPSFLQYAQTQLQRNKQRERRRGVDKVPPVAYIDYQEHQWLFPCSAHWWPRKRGFVICEREGVRRDRINNAQCSSPECASLLMPTGSAAGNSYLLSHGDLCSAVPCLDVWLIIFALSPSLLSFISH